MKRQKTAPYATRSVGQQAINPSSGRGPQSGSAVNPIFQMQKIYGNQKVERLVTQYRSSAVQRMQEENSSGSSKQFSIPQIQPVTFAGTGPNRDATLVIRVEGNSVRSIWSRGEEIHKGYVTFGIRQEQPIITWVQAVPEGQGVGSALMYFAALVCQKASVDSIFVDNVLFSARDYYEKMSFTAHTEEVDGKITIHDTNMIGETSIVLSAAQDKFQKGWVQEVDAEQESESSDLQGDEAQSGTNKKKNKKCSIQ